MLAAAFLTITAAAEQAHRPLWAFCTPVPAMPRRPRK